MILVTAVAVAAGLLLRRCGQEEQGASSQAGKKAMQSITAAEPPQERIPQIVTVVLRDDKIYSGGRQISWVRFNILMREAYQQDQQLELVIYKDTIHTEVMRRAEHDLGQGGVRYFHTYK